MSTKMPNLQPDHVQEHFEHPAERGSEQPQRAVVSKVIPHEGELQPVPGRVAAVQEVAHLGNDGQTPPAPEGNKWTKLSGGDGGLPALKPRDKAAIEIDF